MDKFNYLKEQLTAALATWQQTNGGKTTVGWIHAANPEVIEALLAELEAKDKRIAELEEEFSFIMGQNDGMENELRDKDARIEHLEAKLATPVRLPLLYSPDPWMSPDPGGTWLDKEDVKKSIRTAGFTVEGA